MSNMNDISHIYFFGGYTNSNKPISNQVFANILKTIIGPGVYRYSYSDNTSTEEYSVGDIMIYFDTDLSKLDSNTYVGDGSPNGNDNFNVDIYKCIKSGTYSVPDNVNFKQLSLSHCIY